MGGAIDIHAHGLGPWGTGDWTEPGLRELARIFGSAGTEGLLLTLYPADAASLRRQIETVGRFMDDAPETGSARVLGVHLEGPFLNPTYAGALDRRSFRPPDLAAASTLLDGVETIVRTMTVAPELPGADDLIRSVTGRGIRVQMGHSGASWEEAARGKEAGATGVTHLWNAMAPFHHRAPGLVGFALWDPDLYVELVPDGEHLADGTLDLVLRMKSPDRIIFVSDCVPGGPDGTDSAVRDTAGKLLGGGAPLARLAERLRKRGVPAHVVAAGVRDNALRYLGIEEKVSGPADTR